MVGRRVKVQFSDRSFGVFHQSIDEYRAARNFLDFEPEFLEAFKQVAQQARVVYDIGGYIGLYSLTAAAYNPVAEVYCFEAQSENFQAISRNARANDCDSIHVFQTLLGDRESTRLPFTRAGQTGRVASGQVDERNCESCASTTLDSLVAAEDLPGPDLVKIDVEGYEAHVLRGMEGILTQFKPTVLLEVHPHLLQQHGESSDEVDRLMASQGYAKRLLRAPGIGTVTSHQQSHVVYQHSGRNAA